MLRRAWIWTVVAVATVTFGGLVVWAERGTTEVDVSTAQVTAGPVSRMLIVTGTIQPVRTVQVGAQVSGIIEELPADFNSIVKTGEIVARIDPEALQAQLKQAQAAAAVAEANLQGYQSTLKDAKTRSDRAETLRTSDLIDESDLEDARLTMEVAQDAERDGESVVTQSKAAVDQALVNVDHTIIRSPIDGVVIARNVDVGQTVSAAVDAPVLFTMAADFKDMQVQVNVDESDVGEVTSGESVTFSVDAYPGQTFNGRVRLVRLQPLVGQAATAFSATGATSSTPTTASGNQSSSSAVVSYVAIVTVRNDDERLRPGMTAEVSMPGLHRDQAIRLPNNALTFRPSNDTLKAAGQSSVSNTTSGPRSDTQAREVWEYDGRHFTSIVVHSGLADDAWTELVSGSIHSGDLLVTGATVKRRSRL